MTTEPIAMVSSRAQPDIGGVESHVAEVAGRLARAGHQLEVLTTDRSGQLRRVEEYDGYQVRRFRSYPTHRDWYFSPGLFFALLRGRHAFVHVQGVHTLVPPMAMLAAWLKRKPYMLTFHSGGHSSPFRERARATQWRLLGPLLRRARVLVGVSEFEAHRFETALHLSAGSIRVIRNGGSLPSPSSGVSPDPDLVVSVGRLERYKGHHRAIEALPELLAHRPNAHLQILGAGPYEGELRAIAQRLGVANRVEVTLVPPPDRQQMADRLAQAGVMVLLSDYEAHPVAVMEALAAGRPAVVARTSGLTELADMGWVEGVDANASPAAVAAAINRQLSDPVVPDADKLPTWETCVEALSATYHEILAAG
ncbi:MAG: glycosyltransferase family 4 protein [Acidimicrobiaceae bacterium]|nr:glycosyltransferase family 4 protein [Acidimicrobiaceae bacterium]